jgi:type III secretion protein U
MSGEKTEQPTDKRLRDAREKGQVARSQEVPSAAVVLTLAVYLVARGPGIAVRLIEMAEVITELAFRPFDEAFGLALSVIGSCLLYVLGPLIPMVILASLLGNLGQIGLLFSVEAAMPKIENLSPAKWFKKTFSKDNLFDLIKNIIKVTVLAFVVRSIILDGWSEMSLLPLTDAKGMSSFIGDTVIRLTLVTSAAFAALAAVDFVWKRFKFTKDNMMTKDEVKREYKESEGDPIIKSRRRQLHQELASQGAMDSVRKAKVLITNPTRYAVALDYEEGRTPLPVVLAKGEGELARRMIAVAEREGVPVMREAPLARELYEGTTENSYIPRNLIGPVAEVLRWLKAIEKRSGR